MKKAAVIFNWIALVWTILGAFQIFGTEHNDPWALVFIVIIIVAQVTALLSLR